MCTYRQYKQVTGLIAIFILFSACTKPRFDIDHDIRVVAVSMPPTSFSTEVREISPGMRVELHTKEPRVGMTYKWQCSQEMEAPNPAALAVALPLYLFAVMRNPFILAKAVTDAAGADTAAEVQMWCQSLNDALPNRSHLDHQFKQSLVVYAAQKSDYSFRPALAADVEQKEYYEHLLQDGIDAVLEIEDIGVILIGKKIKSLFRLRVCTSVHLISTRSAKSVFSKRMCIKTDSHTIDEWSHDQWSRLREKTENGLEQAAKRLINRFFVIPKTTSPTRARRGRPKEE